MINLLPPDTKQSYVYARRNVVLRRWVLAFAIALVGLVGVSTYGLLGIQQSTKALQTQAAVFDERFKQEDYAGTQKKVDDMSSSFKLVVQVLGKEILFSEMIKQITTLIPAKANLTSLNINQVQGGIDISAVATDYNTASQVQVNLADPANKLFAKADIVSITCNPASATDPKYPCNVTVRALFASKNPFLLINNKAAKP